MVNKPSALRKGRYMSIDYDKFILILQIKDSTVIKKASMLSNVFNTPIECIEIVDNILIIEETPEPRNLFSSFNILKDLSKEYVKDIINDQGSLFISISKLRFPDEEHKTLYKKMKSRVTL